MQIILDMSLAEYFNRLGIRAGQHLILHAAYRQIRGAFPGYRIEFFLQMLMNQVGDDGSLIMPSFTYNFRRKGYPDMRFDRDKSPSHVGAVSETFRSMPGVIRTSGPTHSFCLWGRAAAEISAENSPASPLGAGSALEWLAGQSLGFVTMIGVNFTAFSFGHYLENAAPVPWHDVSPWEHLKVEPVGLHIGSEQHLVELPGCSQSFVRFEKYLLDHGYIKPVKEGALRAYHIPVGVLLEQGIPFYRDQPQELLCEPGACPACDERWTFFLKSLKDLKK